MDLKIDKGMLKSLKVLSIVVGVLGLIYISMYIWGILGGTVFAAVTNSSLDVTTDTTTYLGATEDDFFSDLGEVRDTIGIAISLLALVIILLLFGGIFKGQGKKNKGSGDMGY